MDPVRHRLDRYLLAVAAQASAHLSPREKYKILTNVPANAKSLRAVLADRLHLSVGSFFLSHYRFK
jgi:hypothetical protein